MLHGISNREAALRAADDKVCCSNSPDSHEEHIKCSSARAELATDLIVHRLAQTSYCGCFPMYARMPPST